MRLTGIDVKTKHFLIFLLVLISLFLAFNYNPPIMAPIEEEEIYHYFLPTTFSPLILSISEDPSTKGTFNSFGGYAS